MGDKWKQQLVQHWTAPGDPTKVVDLPTAIKQVVSALPGLEAPSIRGHVALANGGVELKAVKHCLDRMVKGGEIRKCNNRYELA